ncbi:hypothetical protein GLAREA_01177 [Glarea lozoyensis ATCC 20868]|uniref:Indole-diterpene biosynthesis protein PaxU n=1 Tax=Glarea lozoyensis (strain ATCC 20868 / MF5171) TaxID=1116229 RepID=S3CHD0_GLAL2|nr:uncharacterized protein GLAREA_01177 [Glarea lozoyensis ATCC 20868]EPE25265.1 hypothetical protein GLAREA_01177 [Glarea lozoyensis ATCC 20868]
MSALKKPNLEFANLNSIISLYTPPTTSPASSTDPTTIIFCSWMAAHPKSRYVNLFFNHYHELYPAARIIHIASLASFFTHTLTSTRTALFKPIAATVDSDISPEKRILVHVVSNGGVLSFVDACQAYKTETGNILPLKAIVLDSAPGKFVRDDAYYAMSQGFPKGLLYYPVAAVVYAIFVGWEISSAAFGTTTIVEKSGEKLNDWDLVDEKAKRLYIYSKEDKIVGWKAVEEHAGLAKEKGEVVVVRFDGSAHVQHMLSFGERYWELVRALWRRTM